MTLLHRNRNPALTVMFLAACLSTIAMAQQFPWRAGDQPPLAGGVALGASLGFLDSVFGAPSSVKYPSPGRVSRLYQSRGISIIADSSTGVEYVLVFTRDAGDLGNVRVGDTRESMAARFGKPDLGRGEIAVYRAGSWTIAVQLDVTNEFVQYLQIGRSDLFPDSDYGFVATLRRVTSDMYHEAKSLGILAFFSWGNFVLWRKFRFWIPNYVHVLAVLALLLICWLNWMWIRAGGQLTIRRVIIICFFPLIVYFFFVGYGGVRAAMSRASSRERT